MKAGVAKCIMHESSLTRRSGSGHRRSWTMVLQVGLTNKPGLEGGGGSEKECFDILRKPDSGSLKGGLRTTCRV